MCTCVHASCAAAHRHTAAATSVDNTHAHKCATNAGQMRHKRATNAHLMLSVCPLSCMTDCPVRTSTSDTDACSSSRCTLSGIYSTPVRPASRQLRTHRQQRAKQAQRATRAHLSGAGGQQRAVCVHAKGVHRVTRHFCRRGAIALILHAGGQAGSNCQLLATFEAPHEAAPQTNFLWGASRAPQQQQQISGASDRHIPSQLKQQQHPPQRRWS